MSAQQPPSAEPEAFPVVFVDHSADPGGGQLGLLRYLAHSRGSLSRVIFLAGGSVAAKVAATGTQTTVLTPQAFKMKHLVLTWRALRRSLKHSNSEVVVANSLYAAAALAFQPKRRGKQWIYYSRVSMESLRGVKRFIAVYFIFRRFDSFLANSNWTASCIPRILRRRGVEIAYPVSGIPDSIPQRAVPACSRENIRIVTLSRPDRWKGLDLVVEAVSGQQMEPFSKRVRVDMYGGSFFSDPDYLRELDTMAASSSVQIRRHDHVDDVSAVLANADIVVLPTRMPEPFGQVVPQAMSHGCVVVVPNEGGPMEVVEDGASGLVFEARSADSLRSVILSLLNGDVRGSEIAEAAQEASLRFTDTLNTRMLTASLDRLANRI